jgi:hypothetical protein
MYILLPFYTDTSYLSIINSEKTYLLWKRGQSISTETVMQFTEEHVNKIFQAHRFLYCDQIVLILLTEANLDLYILTSLSYMDSSVCN